MYISFYIVICYDVDINFILVDFDVLDFFDRIAVLIEERCIFA